MQLLPETFPPTIGHLIVVAAQQLQGSSLSPRLDAEIFMQEVTGLTRLALLMKSNEVLAEKPREHFLQCVQRRQLREPVAYITGHKEFFGLEFAVGPAVLIPRPETENLVEQALEFLSDFCGTPKILDLGTGSGCIAISIAAALERDGRPYEVIAVDQSAAALKLAARNSETYGLTGKIKFSKSNWYSEIAAGLQFDVIVSNPPYIEKDSPDVSADTQFEPEKALYSGKDGLTAIKTILKNVSTYLTPGGLFLCELGCNQGAVVLELLKTNPALEDISIIRDLADLDRVAVARRVASTL